MCPRFPGTSIALILSLSFAFKDYYDDDWKFIVI
jgi:hypothetical protein